MKNGDWKKFVEGVGRIGVGGGEGEGREGETETGRQTGRERTVAAYWLAVCLKLSGVT